MKKRHFTLILLFTILSGIAVGGYVYLKKSTKTKINAGLSERSKEFIASQKKQQDSSWQTVNLEKKRAGESDFDSNRISVNNCYSVVVPFHVADDRQNAPCVYYAILASPRGTMTTNLRTVGFASVNEAPDVTLRRGKKETYQESGMTVNGQSVLVFTDTTGASGRVAFVMIEGKLFTVSLNIAAAEDVQMRQIRKILESVVLE